MPDSFSMWMLAHKGHVGYRLCPMLGRADLSIGRQLK